MLSLDALSRAQSVTNALDGRATPGPTGGNLPARYMTGENGVGAMTHELTFSELVVALSLT